jgi:MFS family permease
VFVTGLFAAAQFGKISLTLAPLAELYGTDIAGVSFFVSLVGFLGIFLGVISGAVVARAGPTRVFIWSAGIAAIISILQALLPPFAGMIVLRLLEGLTHLGIVVAGPTLMAAVTNDRDRPIAMSLWAMFFGASFAAVALVVPPLMQAGGVGLVFAAHGLGFAVICAVLIWRLPLFPQHQVKLRFGALMWPFTAARRSWPLRWLSGRIRSYIWRSSHFSLSRLNVLSCFKLSR